MARDAIEPGPGNTYPAFPRKADGEPYWSDRAETDGIGIVVNGVTVAPMPRGLRLQDGILIDVTPMAGSEPVDPPVLTGG